MRGRAHSKQPRAQRKPRWRQFWWLLLAGHPISAVVVGIGIGAVIYADHRNASVAASSAGAVFLIAVITGLGNDISDADRDGVSKRPHKPLGQRNLARGNATFALSILVLLGIPVAIQDGIVAGAALLACLPVAWIHNRFLHTRWLSWLPWAATGALVSGYVAAEGVGARWRDGLPTWQFAASAAATGIALHFVTALKDLHADHAVGSRSLPLRIALRTNATVLLILTVLLVAGAATAATLAALGPGLHSH